MPLPEAVATMLRARIADRDDPDAPVHGAVGCGRRTCGHGSASRSPMTTVLRGTTPHTLRRTVGTLVAHEVGLDAARDLLGHSDPSVTFQHYTGRRKVAPDVRDVLNLFLQSWCSRPSSTSAAEAPDVWPGQGPALEPLKTFG